MSSLNLAPVQLSESCADLRQQVRAFLAEEIRNGGFEPGCDALLGGFDAEFSRRLGQRGWVGMTIPKEYGGGGHSALERFVVTEELLAAGAPIAAHWAADRQIGPGLMRFGTELQKQKFLPAIASGECFFALGMSEPGSGSDLASVRTKAEKIAGGWAVEGTKIWSSQAHCSHYYLLICRTSELSDNRHAGLSQLIVDLKSPGLTITPVKLLDGSHHFNQVFLDRVVVPDEMVFGKIGEGWSQITSELAYERSGPERFMSTLPLLHEFIRHAKSVAPDPEMTRAIGELTSAAWSLRSLSLSIAGALDQGSAPNAQAAMVKDLGTRFEGEVAERIRQVLDCTPALEGAGRLAARSAEAILRSPGYTLRGGTNEILRGVVAKGLGLR